MRKISGAVAMLSLATVLIGVQTTPVSAQVVVNNVFSPFTSIQVGPGVRSYGHGYYRHGYDGHGYYGHGSSTSWINDPRHHQRCYRRWDPYFGKWQSNCVRMHYGPYYGHGQYYRHGSNYGYGPYRD